MIRDNFRSWQLKIINGCLLTVVVATLAPQYWPGTATLSGVVAIMCGAVVAVVYFVRPVSNSEEIDAEAHAERELAKPEDAQSEVVLDIPAEVSDVVATTVKAKSLEASHDLYGVFFKDDERAAQNLVLIPSGFSQRHLERARHLLWEHKFSTLERAKRAGSGQAVYIVSSEKIRRKIPRSQREGVQSAVPPLRSDTVH